MRDASGQVIYVGKAKCLKDRLASYYSHPLGYTRKMDGLLQNVKEIETIVLGSELEALLVDGGHVRRKSADRDAEMALDEVLAEGRRMGRATACAGHDRSRSPAIQHRRRPPPR